MADAPQILSALVRCGLVSPGQDVRMSPLAGGVSCDVFKVDTDDKRVFVVKRALGRLRVAVEWLAPVDRM
jgi:hypothetical protein